jgi:hypothetical protein
MKRLIITITFFVLSYSAKSQFDVFIGSTFYNIKSTISSKFGINTGFNIGPMHYTLSTNFVSNKGDDIDIFIGDGIFKKLSVTSLNIGIDIPIKNINNLSLIPYVGIMWTKEIYNSHGYIFNLPGNNLYDFGLTGKYLINDKMGVMLSVGYRELIKVSYCYNIIKK